jgi:hypothetical protein
VERKKMRDVNVGERDGRAMRVKDLERKEREREREEKKGEKESETYERIQGMRRKNRLRRIITSKLNF